MTAAELRRGVEETLERSAFSDGKSEIRLVGRVARKGRGWQVVLSATLADGSSGRRELESDKPDCRELDEPVILVVALMLEGQLEVNTEPDPKPTSKSAKPQPREPTTPVEADPSPLPVRPWSFEVGLDGRVGAGLLPGVTGGVGAQIEARPPPDRWGFGLGGAYWPGSGARELRAGAQRGGDFEAWSVAVFGCRDILGGGALRLDACAHAGAGQIAGRPIGLELDASLDETFWELGLTARLTGRFTDWAGWQLRLRGAAPLQAPRFVYDDAEGARVDVFEVSPVVGQLSGGLFFRLGP